MTWNHVPRLLIFLFLKRWFLLTPVRNQLVTLWKKLRVFCGAIVGGVRPKMKSCYVLRVKQRLAFCCPLLPNKLFFVFWEVRLLPGVLRFPHVMVIFAKSTHVCAICVQTCFLGLISREIMPRLSLTFEVIFHAARMSTIGNPPWQVIFRKFKFLAFVLLWFLCFA